MDASAGPNASGDTNVAMRGALKSQKLSVFSAPWMASYTGRAGGHIRKLEHIYSCAGRLRRRRRAARAAAPGFLGDDHALTKRSLMPK